MLNIITQAGSFIAIIILGYALKMIGVFKDEDFSVLSKVVIRVTLPCAIITSFAGKTIDPALASLPVIAFLCGITYVAVGYFGRGSREKRAFDMVNLPCYNIGTFVIPFAQSFLGPMGVVAVSIFDTGNAVIGLGGAYGLACMVKDGSRFSIRRIVRALSRSVPFVVYMIMLLMNVLHLKVPGFVLSIASVGAGANAFMAMLMIGVGFKLQSCRAHTREIVRLLSIRYGLAVIFALVFYYALPFALEIRQALVILAFSPFGSTVPGFTSELGGDVSLSSALNSIAMIISIAIIVALLLAML